MIIPLFVMYGGCPNRCVFCNVQKTAGNCRRNISVEALRKTVQAHLRTAKKSESVQIAFYGGSFTGMERKYQIELLGMARSFVRLGVVDGIRVSTRPDYLDEARIALLEEFGVNTVEIGAQSLVDDVLERSGRGHSADDVARAVTLLKRRGFQTGVQLMAGLPGDNAERFAFTVGETISLGPHTVRLHPTIVLPDTPLADAYIRGEYKPLPLAESIEICKWALRKFAMARISVIRIGLQTTAEMEAAGGVIAGPFHPAFRSLVEESLFLDMATALLSSGENGCREAAFFLSPRDVSHLRGQKNKNLLLLKTRFGLRDITLCADPGRERGSLALAADGGIMRTTSITAPPIDNIPNWL
ncbi:MAG: radical SAM protein [Deltaproteobacteria bacterium]|nr:radical SAM protein [Deltaproteobacteria bacterium]